MRRALIVVALLAAGVLGSSCSREGPPAPQPSVPPLTAAEGQAIEAALVSQEVQNVLAVIATDVRGAYQDGGNLLLPPGTTLTIDLATFVAYGGTGSVRGTLSGSATGSWELLLVREDDTWRVYGTRAS